MFINVDILPSVALITRFYSYVTSTITFDAGRLCLALFLPGKLKIPSHFPGVFFNFIDWLPSTLARGLD